MFLHIVNQEEKEKFLELAYKVANVDGEYAEEEIEIINSFKNELGLDSIADTQDLDGLIDYFSKKSNELKKLIYFEVLGLVSSDDVTSDAETTLLNLMENKFGLDAETITKINVMVERLQKIYDEIYDEIFD